ncbi:MAG: hypothetical protein HN509_08025 [Halobacteriovoraceae bacterium]|mgnify:FL=1|jgi:hypothetical protein|nr:hypothetical protein [Halobacteriovoraceae bacterium]
MEAYLALTFRLFGYIVMGLSLEIFFSAWGIELCLGHKLQKQTPHRYLEGFVSLYMIPVHGLGMLFGFEAVFELIASWPTLLRYLFWCLSITGVEALTGFLFHKSIGFYPWDYYKNSKFKIFKEGYSLYTLIPLWGIAGIFLEFYSSLLNTLSPIASRFLINYFF